MISKRIAGLAAAGTIAVTGLSLGTATSASAASIESTTSSASDTTYTVVAKKFDDGASATITLTSSGSDDVTTTKTTVSESGKLSYTFAPESAGKYIVKFSADGETAKKVIKIGSAYKKITVKAKNTSDKTTTISGTAAADSTIKVKIYDPSGDLDATKTVTVDADGNWSTTFSKATEDGEYDVDVTYVNTDTNYGVKTYTDTFDRT
ncbi:Ig-like domain-containing protein [Nocardioides sp.]|uniref:Ig-like domain-containing protein n=1 Tax=Nocardioides sp. TaxID=35761 RepID=UPI0039E5743C